jgi:hypothetical protein
LFQHFYLITSNVMWPSDEYKGQRLLESAKQADVAHVKKQLSSEIVNFKHPLTGDTALVSATHPGLGR